MFPPATIFFSNLCKISMFHGGDQRGIFYTVPLSSNFSTITEKYSLCNNIKLSLLASDSCSVLQMYHKDMKDHKIKLYPDGYSIKPTLGVSTQGHVCGMSVVMLQSRVRHR